VSRSRTFGSPWADRPLPSWKAERVKPPPNEDPKLVCRTCGAEQSSERSMRAAGTWYRLRLVADVPADSTDAAPGSYCSLDCLTVAVLKPYGMSEDDVRGWLAGRS
jgi:hypothetical protein